MIDVVKLAIEAGGTSPTTHTIMLTDAEVVRFAALIVEECAKVCESMQRAHIHGSDYEDPHDCAVAIRQLVKKD